MARLGGHLVPALRAQVADQLLSSTDVHFLHKPDDLPPELPAMDRDAFSAYSQQQRQAHRLHQLSGCFSPRNLLTSVEEQRVMGTFRAATWPPAWMLRDRHQTLRVQPCATDPGLVAATEQRLRGLVVETAAPRSAPPYPLALGSDAQPLERDMHQELRESWEAYHSLPVAASVAPGAGQVIAESQVREAACCTWQGVAAFKGCQTG